MPYSSFSHWCRGAKSHLGLAIAVGLFTFLLAPVTTGQVAAHVLKQDHDISGVLHIAPDDAPVAAEPTVLDVSFGDAKNAFNLTNCDCQVMVKKDTRAVQTVTLRPSLAGSTLNSTATVQFPVIGVYDVIVRGSAKDGSFPAFQLDYPARVATTAGGSRASSNNVIIVVIIGLGGLAILSLFAYTYRRKNND